MISKINIGGTKMAIQDKFNKPNTIYKITKDIDLGESTLTIPEGCTLDFQGGSFSNGTIVGNNTIISNVTAGNILFYEISFSGTFVCSSLYDRNFSYIEKLKLFKAFEILANSQRNTNIYISEDVVVEASIEDIHYVFDIPSNVHIFLNATISLSPNDYTHYTIFNVLDKNNVVISGSGSLIGDVKEHTGDEGEWGFCIHIVGSENITVDGIGLKEAWGDGISVDSSTTKRSRFVTIKNCYIYGNRRQGISLEGCSDVIVDNCVIEDTGKIKFTGPGSAIDIEPWREGEYAENITISNCIDKNNTLGIVAYKLVKNCLVENCYINGYMSISAEDITYRNCNMSRQLLYLQSSSVYEYNLIKFEKCRIGCVYLETCKNVRFDDCTFTFEDIEDTIISNNASFLLYISATAYGGASIEYDRSMVINGGSINLTKTGVGTGFMGGTFSGTYKVNILVKKADIERSGVIQVRIGNFVSCYFTCGYLELMNSTINDTKFINNIFDFSSSDNYGLTISAVGSRDVAYTINNNTFLNNINNREQYITISSNVNFGDKQLVFVNNILPVINTDYIKTKIFTPLRDKVSNLTAVFPESCIASPTENITPTYYQKGLLNYDESNRLVRWWDGERWIAPNGLVATKYAVFNDVKPSLVNNTFNNGTPIFNLSYNRAEWWTGTHWVDADGNTAALKKGTTLERPTGVNEGFDYYDSTLKKKILWNGINWVNLDGTALA